jgi:hypothetical protein
MEYLMRLLFILTIIASVHAAANGQVLISILLGDKLNSDKVEFGLEGGLNISGIDGVDPSSGRTGLNLGFYFDFKLKDPRWMIHTGVLVKSNMGAEDIKVYSLDDPDLDNIFSGGSVIRKLGYFNVPFMMKYQWQNHIFVEGGPMFGLMNKSTDEFVATVKTKEDLTYKLKIKDRYHPLDAGVMIGVGYRLQGGNGMNLQIRYYYGFVDTTIDDSMPGQYNRTLYINVGIPIGIGKKAAKE